MDAEYAVGDRVVIQKHKTKLFVGEPGTIITFCGEGMREFAVVATCGQQPLVRIEDLGRES